MFTYIINTSTNKSIDSTSLFKLISYQKLYWLENPLDKIDDCLLTIQTKQTVLDAEKYQIGIIVDLVEFNKIRKNYGLDGYDEKNKVDASLYYPFLETYLIDHVFNKLAKMNIPPEKFDIFYIQGVEETRYNISLKNKNDIIKILTGKNKEKREVAYKIIKNELTKEEFKTEIDYSSLVIENGVIKEIIEKEKNKEDNFDIPEFVLTKYRKNEKDTKFTFKNVIEEKEGFSSFQLEINNNVSLEFKLSDYPYTGYNCLDFDEFLISFINRINDQSSNLNKILTNHYYYPGPTINDATSSYEMLSLSLYIIKKYERGDIDWDINGLEISKLNPELLRNTLELSWNKIRCAKLITQNPDIDYFDINKIANNFSIDKPEEKSLEEKLNDCRYEVKNKIDPKSRKDCEFLYQEVMSMSSGKLDCMDEKQQNEVEEIITTFLNERDLTRDDDDAFNPEFLNDGDNAFTKQFPTDEDFNFIIKNKEIELSDYLSTIFNAGFLSIDYSQERKDAIKAYRKYCIYKDLVKKKIGRDLLLLIFILLIMIIPYIVINSVIKSFNPLYLILYLCFMAFFTGVFIISISIVMIPIVKKIMKAKSDLKSCYLDCLAKKEYSISSLKRMYNVQLTIVENARYNIRKIRFLQNINKKKNDDVNKHRVRLDEIETKLASLLNNLGVQPTIDRNIDLKNEFNVKEPFDSRMNKKIYQIFSLDVLEKLFDDFRR